jgi:hypothetical protein
MDVNRACTSDLVLSAHLYATFPFDIRIRILDSIQERPTEMWYSPSHALTTRLFPITFLFPSVTLDTREMYSGSLPVLANRRFPN